MKLNKNSPGKSVLAQCKKMCLFSNIYWPFHVFQCKQCVDMEVASFDPPTFTSTAHRTPDF